MPITTITLRQLFDRCIKSSWNSLRWLGDQQFTELKLDTILVANNYYLIDKNLKYFRSKFLNFHWIVKEVPYISCNVSTLV